jgi:hypothetical protein
MRKELLEEGRERLPIKKLQREYGSLSKKIKKCTGQAWLKKERKRR